MKILLVICIATVFCCSINATKNTAGNHGKNMTISQLEHFVVGSRFNHETICPWEFKAFKTNDTLTLVVQIQEFHIKTRRLLAEVNVDTIHLGEEIIEENIGDAFTTEYHEYNFLIDDVGRINVKHSSIDTILNVDSVFSNMGGEYSSRYDDYCKMHSSGDK